MAFGRKSKPSRIYSYDCYPPDNIEEVNRQMLLAHVFRNKLVRLDLERRVDLEESQRQLYPSIAFLSTEEEGLEAQISELDEIVKRRRKQERRRAETGPEKDRLRDCRKRLAIVRRDLKKEKEKFWEDSSVKQAIDEITEQHKRARTAVRHSMIDEGLYWPTANAIQASINPHGRPPVFHPRHVMGDGRDPGIIAGKIDVQLQNGMSIEKAFSCTHGFLQISPLPRNAWDTPSRRHKRTTAKLRISSSDKKKPIWASVNFVMHRPLPEGSLIKSVFLIRKAIGPHARWQVQLVVAQNTKEDWCRFEYGDRLLGIDVGWREIDEGLRVAYWTGSDGQEGQIIIPHRELSRWSRVSEIQDLRDNDFNLIRARVADWLGARSSLPEWLQEASKNIGLWKSKRHLSRLYQAWLEPNRAMPGDGEIVAALRKWYWQDQRDHEAMESIRLKAIRWRDDFYRNEVVRLVKAGYGRAAVEEMNVRQLQEKPKPGEDRVKVGGGMAAIASVGKLLSIVVQTIPTTKVDPYRTTMTCHVCKKVCDFDKKTVLINTCEHCSAVWDQDKNASVNLLEALSDEEAAVSV